MLNVLALSFENKLAWIAECFCTTARSRITNCRKTDKGEGEEEKPAVRKKENAKMKGRGRDRKPGANERARNGYKVNGTNIVTRIRPLMT